MHRMGMSEEGLKANHYERAFESWLIDSKVRYVGVDQSRRAAFNNVKLKSFDFILYPPNSDIIIAEVKGRKFDGANPAGRTALDCWASLEEVYALESWQRIFGRGHKAMLVFAYLFGKIDVEADGREVYDFCDRRYMFLGVTIDDYKRCMKVRSPKWQTVTLPAAEFRACAVPLHRFLLDGQL